MGGFKIDFSTSAWWLLLLIPAVALALLPYFRLNKKYRRTRNRVTSVVLHCLVMLFAVCVLSGMTFVYEIPNLENEIILLVDVSDTADEAKSQRDACVNLLLQDGRYDGYKMGIVTFGFTQRYTVPLTYDIEGVYDQYVSATTPGSGLENLPDVSATDIAAALKYTQTLFTQPETAKIVLITDGKETDESAMSVVAAVTAQGIRLDTIHLDSSYRGEDVQITGVEFPSARIEKDSEFVLSVTLDCNIEAGRLVTLEVYDNGEQTSASGQTFDLKEGSQVVTVRHTFTTYGLHELRFRISEEDAIDENSGYYAYIHLDVYKKVLIIESREGTSSGLTEILSGDDLSEADKFETTVINAKTGEIPATVDALRAYDQVILNNIANADLPEEFFENLYSYVYDYGGGLFTVGGSNEDETAHAYNREDMYNTVYQQMLPVEAVNYTPPLGVIVIIDVSGSMVNTLDNAKAGAQACLDSLSERDYIGVMTCDTNYGRILDLTPRTHEAEIVRAIQSVQIGGSTNYNSALETACTQLQANKNLAKRHIILVTDGLPADLEASKTTVGNMYAAYGITVSVVGIDADANARSNMEDMVALGHGRFYAVSGGVTSEIVSSMREDLRSPEIKDVNVEPFYPIIYNTLSPVVNGVEYNTVTDGETDGEGTATRKRQLSVQLGGFYGVKVKDQSYLVLVGDYEVPIYAQWSFGNGMVGSFMCDLSGDWSADFLADDNGKTIVRNAVSNLMPQEDIRPKEIVVQMTAENYMHTLAIDAKLAEGEYVRAEVVYTDTASAAQTKTTLSLNEVTDPAQTENAFFYVTSAMTADNLYSGCAFVLKKSGVYTISVVKYNASDEVVETVTLYRSLSYSAEYDAYAEETVDPETFLTLLADAGGGTKIADSENPTEVFENFVTELIRSFDPRWLFMILAMVLFLADVAVRKFKFKWPHEIVRAVRERKASGRAQH